jgi:hypothetical protein
LLVFTLTKIKIALKPLFSFFNLLFLTYF